MRFTDEITRHLVVKSNAAPYPAYAVIDIWNGFVNDLLKAHTAFKELISISDWFNIEIHAREDIIWIPENVFKDTLTKIAWEEYGNGTYCYAHITEEELNGFIDGGINLINIEICSFSLTQRNEFFFHTEAYSPITESRETFISQHVSVDEVLEPLLGNYDELEL